jgi:hypothetical protein
MRLFSSTRAGLQFAFLGLVPYRMMRRRMQHAPFPAEDVDGHLPGPLPIFIAVIGEATAIGYQTLTTNLTVGAQLGRRLHQRSNRGVRWQAMATSDFTIRTARILLRENPRLVVVDVMIVILGIGDAVRFTTPAAWRAHLTGLLADLQQHLASTATILIAEIPPLELSPEVPKAISHRVGHHAHVLNVITRDVVADIDMAQCVPFPSALVHDFETPDGHDTFYGRVYRSWAAVMAEQIVVRTL